jgi:hypothetical protein
VVTLLQFVAFICTNKQHFVQLHWLLYNEINVAAIAIEQSWDGWYFAR